MGRRTGKFAFDRGLDYGKTKGILVDGLSKSRSDLEDVFRRKHIACYAVLLVQLSNGARVSEAFEAVEGWCQDLKRDRQVRVRKQTKLMKCEDCGQSFNTRSKTKSPRVHAEKTGHAKFIDVHTEERRLTMIPSEVLDSDAEAVKQGLVSVGAVKVFALKHLGFNTHSLRYAKITDLSRQGYPVQVISKITHHKNLSFVMDYTSQKAADDVLRGSVS